MNQAITPVSLKIDLEHMAEHAEEATVLLKALANKNRLTILCLLSEGELSVGEIAVTIAPRPVGTVATPGSPAPGQAGAHPT
jgi:predicted transcriptional regulator